MKKYAMLILLCLFVQQNLWGKIKNGYETEINEARQLLINLQTLIERDRREDQKAKKLSLFQKGQLKTKMEGPKAYIAYYELTEKLLAQFRSVAPDLYQEIDTLKDGKGRPTDVYVKFMPEEEMRVSVAGTTNITQGKEDVNAYHSEYGAHTVSVRIVIGKKALWLLAHELGHVKYQVPHLAAYVEYYNMHYQDRRLKANYIGHNTNDPSGNDARLYEKRFREYYLSYLKKTENNVETPLVLLQEIKNSLSDEQADF